MVSYVDLECTLCNGLNRQDLTDYLRGMIIDCRYCKSYVTVDIRNAELTDDLIKKFQENTVDQIVKNSPHLYKTFNKNRLHHLHYYINVYTGYTRLRLDAQLNKVFTEVEQW